ncbi:lytic transglycosylase domain-containing protein [Desulfofundulus sp.]|uniref:lytic transglycosylase domain-containing protein n=1 Tax=Desulfofundulus sp. TaxID=2282750 RepID=UPI003C792988
MLVSLLNAINQADNGQKNWQTGGLPGSGESFALLLATALESSSENGGLTEGGKPDNPGLTELLLPFFLLTPGGTELSTSLWTIFNTLFYRQGAERKSSPPGHSEVTVKTGDLGALIDGVAEKYGLEPALLKAVVKVESGFNPLARSPAGAQGLMQLMPATAAAMGVKNPWDPRENLEAGARYLKSLLERFGGNVNLALAAYNAGPGAVRRYGGVPPYRETRQYLQRVAAARCEFLV